MNKYKIIKQKQVSASLSFRCGWSGLLWGIWADKVLALWWVKLWYSRINTVCVLVTAQGVVLCEVGRRVWVPIYHAVLTGSLRGINTLLHNHVPWFWAGESHVMQRLDAFQSPLPEWLVKKGCPVICGYEKLAVLSAHQLSVVDSCWWLPLARCRPSTLSLFACMPALTDQSTSLAKTWCVPWWGRTGWWICSRQTRHAMQGTAWRSGSCSGLNNCPRGGGGVLLQSCAWPESGGAYWCYWLPSRCWLLHQWGSWPTCTCPMKFKFNRYFSN